MRKAGEQEFVSRGLLARAEWFRREKKFDEAEQDLNEVLEIAEAGGMKLHLVDYHLEKARLCEETNEEEIAKEHFAEAGRLVDETGYERRRKEIEKK